MALVNSNFPDTFNKHFSKELLLKFIKFFLVFNFYFATFTTIENTTAK